MHDGKINALALRLFLIVGRIVKRFSSIPLYRFSTERERINLQKQQTGILT